MSTTTTERPTRAGSELEERLAQQIDVTGLPAPEREYMFARHIGRRWRFDFAWPWLMVAVEVEGATFAGGRHTRGSGFAADAEKYNAAAEHGWTVLRYTGGQIGRYVGRGNARRWEPNPEAVSQIARVLEDRAAN